MALMIYSEYESMPDNAASVRELKLLATAYQVARIYYHLYRGTLLDEKHTAMMREMMAAGKLSGPPADLMQPILPREQLFDTEADPHEINNLADSDDPEIQQVLQEMRTALDVWIIETGDRGQVLEPAEIVAPFEKEMHDWFGTPQWYGKN